MRSLLIILSLMFVTGASAQDTIAQFSENQENQVSLSTSQTDGEPSYYTFQDREFEFIPNELGYHIKRIENGKKVDYGTLVLTTDDGYYAMTSNLNDHVSYGRFDEEGNFRGLRYDEDSDAVLEENFVRSSRRGN